MEVKVILSLDEDFKIIANRLLGVLESKLPDKTLYEPVPIHDGAIGFSRLETPVEDGPAMEEYVPKHGKGPTEEVAVEEVETDFGALRESVKEIVVKLVQAKKKDKVVNLCGLFGVKKTTDVPNELLPKFLEELKSL